jgi:hypothetical protein
MFASAGSVFFLFDTTANEDLYAPQLPALRVEWCLAVGGFCRLAAFLAGPSLFVDSLMAILSSLP